MENYFPKTILSSEIFTEYSDIKYLNISCNIMPISLKTHKLLWGHSGNKCAIPDCRKELIIDETETDDESIIGDEAHIIAKNSDGARGENEMVLEDRDKYANLILLCRIHHKVIDDQP